MSLSNNTIDTIVAESRGAASDTERTTIDVHSSTKPREVNESNSDFPRTPSSESGRNDSSQAKEIADKSTEADIEERLARLERDAEKMDRDIKALQDDSTRQDMQLRGVGLENGWLTVMHEEVKRQMTVSQSAQKRLRRL